MPFPRKWWKWPFQVTALWFLVHWPWKLMSLSNQKCQVMQRLSVDTFRVEQMEMHPLSAPTLPHPNTHHYQPQHYQSKNLPSLLCGSISNCTFDYNVMFCQWALDPCSYFSFFCLRTRTLKWHSESHVDSPIINHLPTDINHVTVEFTSIPVSCFFAENKG